MKIANLLFLVVVLLAGCGGTSSEAPNNLPTGTLPLSAAVGTLNYSDRIGTSFMFDFNLETAPPPEGFEVQIFGPRGWNSGDSAGRTYLYKEAGRYATWISIFEDNDGNRMEAISGPYVIQANIDGQTQRVEVELDTSELLPEPTDLTLLKGSASTVSASWSAVPGAASYLVELFETETGSLDESITLYTSTPKAIISELNLTVGGEYRLGVTALPVNFTEGATKDLPQGQFNTSFASQRFTATID